MTKQTIVWEEIEALLAQEAWTDAAQRLEEIDVQRLPGPQREAAAQMLARLPEELRLQRPMLCVRRIQLAAGRGEWDRVRRGIASLASLKERCRDVFLCQTV